MSCWHQGEKRACYGMITDLEAQRGLDKLKRNGFEGLSGSEKTLVTVWLYDAGVSNGGFRHYYESAAGDLAFHVPAALRDIGASQLAEIAAKANAAFGPAGPPREQQARTAIVDSAGQSTEAEWEALEAKYFECPEDVDDLLEAYHARTKR